MNTDKIYAEQIANEYAVKKESKVVALKKLDAAVKQPAKVFAIIFGIFSTLVLGTGMCFAMKVIGDMTLTSMLMGILIGVVGIIGMSINYLQENPRKKKEEIRIRNHRTCQRNH